MANKGSASPIPNNLPARPCLFVNREEEIHHAINVLLNNKSQVVALIGIAGIGKTALALEIAYRLLGMGEFTGGIVWLPARSLQPSDDLAGELGYVFEIPSTKVVSLSLIHI